MAGDESLTPEEYIRLGLPADDRAWSGEVMGRAENVLTTLAQQGYQKLPRYQSERSGKVFARMTSPQNLDMLRSRRLPLDARLPLSISYIQASNGVLKLYLSGFLKNEVRDSEIVALIGAQLRVIVAMFELFDEFLPTLKQDDPTYSARMKGVEQMKHGLATTVAGCLQTLTERDT